ncbi:MAG: hypothetical protein KGL51_11800 [Betaproteobacteria bacterium]|nr:hypothetical protein [Betaproteobacteria bacterium]
MDIWPLTQAEIDGAMERADELQLMDAPAPVPEPVALRWTAAEWRAHQRRCAWWDKIILRVSIAVIIGLALIIGFGVMR